MCKKGCNKLFDKIFRFLGPPQLLLSYALEIGWHEFLITHLYATTSALVSGKFLYCVRSIYARLGLGLCHAMHLKPGSKAFNIAAYI